MDVPVPVVAVLDPSGLERLYGLADILGDRPALRVRHQTARAKDRTELADDRHHVRGGDRHIEVERLGAGLDGIGKLLAPDQVGTGLLCGAGQVALRKYNDADVLAGAVGEADGAANELVGLPGVDSELERHVHALVELGESHLFDELDRLFGPVAPCGIELSLDGRSVLGLGGHFGLLTWFSRGSRLSHFCVLRITYYVLRAR